MRFLVKLNYELNNTTVTALSFSHTEEHTTGTASTSTFGSTANSAIAMTVDDDQNAKESAEDTKERQAVGKKEGEQKEDYQEQENQLDPTCGPSTSGSAGTNKGDITQLLHQLHQQTFQQTKHAHAIRYIAKVKRRFAVAAPDTYKWVFYLIQYLFHFILHSRYCASLGINDTVHPTR